jgi:HK97 family phage prohead protease
MNKEQPIERRFCVAHGLHIEERADGEAPQLVGYAAVFDQLSVELWGFRERIAKGAFAATLTDDVRALWNHDPNLVLGRTKSGTLHLAEDDTGLRSVIDPPKTALVDGFVTSIRRGDVDQMSFAFRTLEDTWDEDGEGVLIRTLLKVKLYDVSPVTYPAYPATSITVRRVDGGLLAGEYGFVPDIPKELRRASDSDTAEMVARARNLNRRRHLQLLGV